MTVQFSETQSFNFFVNQVECTMTTPRSNPDIVEALHNLPFKGHFLGFIDNGEDSDALFDGFDGLRYRYNFQRKEYSRLRNSSSYSICVRNMPSHKKRLLLLNLHDIFPENKLYKNKNYLLSISFESPKHFNVLNLQTQHWFERNINYTMPDKLNSRANTRLSFDSFKCGTGANIARFEDFLFVTGNGDLTIFRLIDSNTDTASVDTKTKTKTKLTSKQRANIPIKEFKNNSRNFNGQLLRSQTAVNSNCKSKLTKATDFKMPQLKFIRKVELVKTQHHDLYVYGNCWFVQSDYDGVHRRYHKSLILSGFESPLICDIVKQTEERGSELERNDKKAKEQKNAETSEIDNNPNNNAKKKTKQKQKKKLKKLKMAPVSIKSNQASNWIELVLFGGETRCALSYTFSSIVMNIKRIDTPTNYNIKNVASTIGLYHKPQIWLDIMSFQVDSINYCDRSIDLKEPQTVCFDPRKMELNNFGFKLLFQRFAIFIGGSFEGKYKVSISKSLWEPACWVKICVNLIQYLLLILKKVNVTQREKYYQMK